MLAAIKRNTFNELVSNASYEELVWMNGYLAGVLSTNKTGNEIQSVSNLPGKITILYGTETGNSKSLATKLANHAKQKGVGVKIASLDQYRLNDLGKEACLFVIISTQGDGEPPAAAQKFYDHIHTEKLSLANLKYAVLALGDTSYPLFCKAGADVDIQLETHGATRISPVQKYDTDYEAEATEWFIKTLTTLDSGTQTERQTVSVSNKQVAKKNYSGIIRTNINLNDIGSAKETHHIEIEAEGVKYTPGDSLSIVPPNQESIVSEIIELSGAERDKQLVYRNSPGSIYDILKSKTNIVYLPERVVKQYAAIVEQEIPVTRIGLADLLRIYPLKDPAQFEQVIEILEPITPRLYSISSAPSFHDGEIHLTVARDQFYINETLKYGLCSDYLSTLSEGDLVHFGIHTNNQFRLPAAEKDIIMIGPGTGIAPFRSFLAERDATGASGKNWLFFGAQHFTTDFLYQTEIQSWHETGIATNVNLAFSRDQEERIYVQHKMLENGAALFSWLDAGAYLYVCGAKEPMSVDVENTLLQIIQEHSRKTETEAVAYLEDLKNKDRYLKDVY